MLGTQILYSLEKNEKEVNNNTYQIQLMNT